MKNIFTKLLALTLVLMIAVSAIACEGTQQNESETPPYVEPPIHETDSSEDNETNAPDEETEAPTETEEQTEAPTEAESEDPDDRIYNYLNGKTTTVEERDRRPVAIMVNNIKESLPQVGICDGDIYYECAAEGGITRIMMVVSDWEKLGTVGSIRSSRDYFVDFLANHDAIYVHAGGSPLAYAKINYREINNLDGVKGYSGNTFWRDPERMQTMAYEHTLMTSGEGIKAAVDMMKYRTELDENQVPLFKFYSENVDNKIDGSPATHVHMQSTSYQTVDFVYNTETGEYLRYQYNGKAHVDGKTGEQLSVKNLLILFTEITVIPGDEAGRLEVVTVGGGQGYYITNGERKVVNWSRDGKTSTMHIEYKNGDELILNSGKTFICVVDDSVANKIDFEYKW